MRDELYPMLPLPPEWVAQRSVKVIVDASVAITASAGDGPRMPLLTRYASKA